MRFESEARERRERGEREVRERRERGEINARRIGKKLTTFEVKELEPRKCNFCGECFVKNGWGRRHV